MKNKYNSQYCKKHNQQYADYLLCCPICLGEFFGKMGKITTINKFLEWKKWIKNNARKNKKIYRKYRSGYLGYKKILKETKNAN